MIWPKKSTKILGISHQSGNPVLSDKVNAVRKLRRPSSSDGDTRSSDTRIPRSTLALTVSLCSAALLLVGSGGIVAEIFHTGQAFIKGRADYAAEANKVTSDALGQYWKAVSAASGEAGKVLAISNNKAQQIRITAQTEVELIRAQAVAEGASAQSLAKLLKAQISPARQELYFKVLRESLSELKKDLNLDIELLVTLNKGDLGSLVLLPIPWNASLDPSIEAMTCLSIPGHTSQTCHSTLVESDKRTDIPTAEPHKQYTLPILFEEQQLQLGVYKRALEDLEEVLVYSALDLSRYRKGEQRADLRLVNQEVSRVNLSLQEVRRRFQQLKELETFYGRSSRDESLPAFEKIIADLFASDMPENNDKDPVWSINQWLTTKVPRFIERAAQDREKELAVRRSEFYQSLRPLLGNLWAASSVGTMSPAVTFGLRAPNTVLPKRPSGVFDSTQEAWPNPQGVSTWLVGVIAMCLFALSGCACWYAFRRSPKWGRLAMLSLAPLLLLVLAVPIHQAFTVNQSTEKSAKELTSEVVPDDSARNYGQRGADAAQKIITAGAEAGSRIEQGAEAERNRIVNDAKARAKRYINASNIAGARNFMLITPYEELLNNCAAVTDSRVRALCTLRLSAGKQRVEKLSADLYEKRILKQTFAN